jgi:hypothetical protein
MRLTTFVYPWDLARLGVARTLEQLVAEGFDGIHLASTYHPIDALSPRGGEVSLFTSARGAVHFPARAERYGRILPSISTPTVGAVWPEVAERARALGLGLSAWTIVLYQPWIVDQYPDCARVLPSGDAIGAGVCPAHSDVREYVATLCEDIVDQFGVDTLHLEGVASSGYDYGWLRPRVFVDVPRPARELLGVCFCGSCRRRGSAAGIDVDRVRRLVNEATACELGGEPGGVDAMARTVDDAEVRAFATQHARATIELVDVIVSRLGAAGAPRRSTMALTPYSSLLGPLYDGLLAELLTPFDQVFVAPRADDKRTRIALAGRAARGLDLAVLVTPAMFGAATGMGVDAPARGRERVAAELEAAAGLGVAEVSLYNYGLLRADDARHYASDARAAFA